VVNFLVSSKIIFLRDKPRENEITKKNTRKDPGNEAYGKMKHE
jgi:hypothetical protein